MRGGSARGFIKRSNNARSPLPAAVVRRGIGRLFCRRDHNGQQLAYVYSRSCQLRLPHEKYLISRKDDFQQNQSNDH
jgi:hypothetical protein